MARRYIDCYHEIGTRISRGETMNRNKINKIKDKWAKRTGACSRSKK